MYSGKKDHQRRAHPLRAQNGSELLMQLLRHRLQLIFMLGLFLAAIGRPAAAGMLTMETPHFNIHFRDCPEAEETAARVAEIAEDIHVTLTERIGHIPTERTEIHLIETSDFANGFADTSYYNRVGIYLVCPTGETGWTSGLSMKVESWLRLVLTHEYAHILHLDMNRGVASTLRRIFGRVPYLTTPNFTLSNAYIEGFAVYEETANTGGGRGVDPYYDMFLRTAVLTDTVPTFDQMLGIYSMDNWQPAATAYLYGWSLVDYIARRFGEEKLAAINRNCSSWSTIGLFQALTRNLGLSAQVFWEEWRRDLEERYRAQAAELEAGGYTPLEELTGPVMAAQPAFSPDGKSLAYVTLGKKTFFPGLYLRDSLSGEDRLLVAGRVTSRPAWSPSGRYLVYAKPDYVDEERLYNDIYLYDLERGEERRLTRGARAKDPAWLPAGDRLVYVAYDNLETYLCGYDLATGESRILYTGSREMQFATPVFSPDGEELAVGVWFSGGYHGIALLKHDGSDFRLLLCDRANNRNPVFTPDGEYILFDSDRDGTHNIYALAPATGVLQKLTRTPAGLFAPAPAPGGEELVVMSYGADGYRLARVRREDFCSEEASFVVETPPAMVSTSTGLQTGRYPVKKYNPLQTLKPKYWLPTMEEDAAKGLRLGIMTGGMDALERHQYLLRVSHGFKSGKPNLLLDYWYDPPGRAAFRLQLGAVTKESKEAGIWYNHYTLDAGISLPFPGLLVNREVFGGFRLERMVNQLPLPVSEETPASGLLYAGVNELGVSGEGIVSYRRERGFTAGLYLTGQETGLTGEGFWKKAYLLRGVSRAALKISAGLAQLPGYFALGGQSEESLSGGTLGAEYTVRGFPSRAVSGAGFVLVNAEVYPLRIPVERGLRDLPVFLRQIRGGFFLDAGYAGDSRELTESGLIAAASAEIRLTTDLLFSGIDFDWRLGVVRPLYPAETGLRLYLAVSREFQ